MQVAPMKTVYKVDDIVTVIEPAVVQRVGYPLTKEMAQDAAVKEYDEKIHAFMCEVSAEPAQFTIHESDPRLYNDLVDALASYWLRLKGYGGKERKIYTETNESLRGTKGWRVLSKRHVKTGTYSSGGYSGGWDGEPDYSPPYLSNEQTHTLLTLEPTDPAINEPWSIEIDAINVLKE